MILPEKPLFLLDACGLPRTDISLPKYLVRQVTQIEKLRESKDSIIKQYLDKENLILITSDYRFGLKMVLSGKKIIFVEDGFDTNYFHIIYPSIRTKKGFFWKPEIVDMLRE